MIAANAPSPNRAASCTCAPRRSGACAARAAACARRCSRCSRSRSPRWCRCSGYVTLTANLTSLNYALVRTDRERTALLEDTQRLDERIARLQSPDRLAALAGKLKLHDPHVYAVVRVPEPKPQPRPTGFALFAWFSSK